MTYDLTPMVATVAFWCVDCGYRQDVPDRLLGRKVRCPKCETRQIVRARGANARVDGTDSDSVSGSVSSSSLPPKAARPDPGPSLPRSPASNALERRRVTETFAGEDTLSSSLPGDTPPTVVRPTTRTVRASTRADTETESPDELSFADVTFKKSQDLPEDEQSLNTDSMNSLAGTSLATIKPSTDVYTRVMALGTGYRLGKVIGRGGMGAVHASEQLSLGRMVAIKTIRADADDVAAAGRFRAEAMVMALLEHPNIIPVHDLVDVQGELRLVMKKIQGVTWRDLIYPSSEQHVKRSLAAKLDDHLDILLKTCDAIAFAHDRGIVHLDLKPANIMVGSFGEVLVLDWGCALATGPVGSDAIPTVADFHGLSGTPAYMAPEMATQSGDLGTTTDVYLLGAILYELVAGQPPHRADSVHASLAAAALNEVAPPRARGGRPAPPELVALALAAMSTDTSKRPPTVAAFAAQVRDYRRHVEAIRLADTAKQHLAAAATDRERADDEFRKAQAACEQAVSQWPEWTAAKELLAQTLLAYSQHSLSTGAHKLAQTHALSALDHFRKLGTNAPDAQLKAAKDVIDLATADERAQRARQKHIRVLVVGLVLVLVLGVIGLTVGLATMSSQRSRIVEESRSAAQALASLRGEQEQRKNEQRAFAPVLIGKARHDVDGRKPSDALQALSIAHEFDPENDDVPLLQAEIHAAQKHWQECVTALTPLRGRIDDANQLATIAEGMIARWTPELESHLASFLVGHGLIALVDAKKLPKDDLEAFYRSAFDAFWNGSGKSIRIANGTIAFEPAEDAAAAHQIRDLSPLHGLPCRELRLNDTRVADLSSLKGMPLTRLALARMPVSDLDALGGMGLEDLDISDTSVADLRPLVGQPLKRLVAAGTPVADLRPLAGLPLEELDLSRTRAADLKPLSRLPLRALSLAATQVVELEPLAAIPLRTLSLRDTRIRDLSELAHIPLTTLDLAGTPVRSLNTISGLALVELDLGGCREITSIADLAGMPLKRLNLVGTMVTDLRPLAAMPLERLDFTPSAITAGIDELRAIPTLKQIGREDAQAFWQRYDRK